MDCQILEELANLEQEHDSHAFQVFSDNKGADGGGGHQEVFVKDSAFDKVAAGFDQDLAPDQEIASEKQAELHERSEAECRCRGEKQDRAKDGQKLGIPPPGQCRFRFFPVIVEVDDLGTAAAGARRVTCVTVADCCVNVFHDCYPSQFQFRQCYLRSSLMWFNP